MKKEMMEHEKSVMEKEEVEEYTVKEMLWKHK
jgi:hypothetical protein